ncbi:Lipoprotein [Collimonas arenae]|uniref:Lipoprotein n=1 Tax=Collimonas arenae TaxID=279058 RepID=A0A0A1F4J3_9BURK|nr:PilN family type IVB pilus formation outer membrane protein [Collimonas arenae]AIY39638.1 Lipoprotein [Collimonas arenae]
MMQIKLCAMLAAAALMCGCSGLTEKLDSGSIDAGARAGRLAKQVGHASPVAGNQPSVTHDAGIWLGNTAVKLDRSLLPPIFYEPTVFDRTVYSLAELAERISLRSGIPVKVMPDALLAATGRLQASGTAGAANPTVVVDGMPPPGVFTSGGNVGGSNQQHQGMHIVYSGNFKNFLDSVTTRYGIFWKYSGGTIQFFYTDIRTFQIKAIPGDSAVSASVNSGSVTGDSGGGGGGSGNGTSNSNNTQTTAVKSQLAVYPSIEKSVTAMLSASGKVVSSPATGTITVVDTPDTLERIASFIEGENKSLSQQVMLNVTVLAVTVNDGDNYGINWSLVYGDLFRNFGIKNVLSTAVTNSSTEFSAGILNTSGSKLAGSKLVIDALSSQGRVRRETSASVVTLNNQPVPLQVAKQTSYLKSSTTTLASNVGATSSLNPGVVTSGFNMTILPHVLNNGTVMLQFSVDISALRRIGEVKSGDGGNLIQTPEVDTRNFLQRVSMKSNQTLIISGFEQTDDNLDRQGVGKANNYLFGGGFNAQANKEVIVILVTPIMMDGA